MRHPLWILNSNFLAVFCLAVLFIFFSWQELPEREDIEFTVPSVSMQQKSEINIKKIYENDLFDTYEKKIVELVKEKKYIMPLPEPPKVVPLKVPKKVAPKFLEPLAITLKGIMAVSDDTKSKIIISDNNTKREAVYKIGNKVQGSRLIRIFKNKAVFIRSNGQQEVFYLNKEDAEIDPTYLAINNWEGVIKKIAPNNYSLSSSEFLKRIKNLSQFIDVLGLTTAYQKGVSVGCRIGHLDENDLGTFLGLKSSDIILTINNLSATNTKNRLDIYKKITNMSLDDIIVVRLQRNKQTYTLRYKLTDFVTFKRSTSPGQPLTMKYIEQEQRKMLEKKHSFAPTVKEIRMQERSNMLRNGRKPRKTHADNNGK